ncbi:hypothetical protein C8J55DRAFT_567602 [Lentinula edodes]|uniref:Uncharacterized protein n=1 Tax=Lentinula lateritia TaxID=40482 RepID=A0A9W8ZQ08_9AGAR|nr:hypothetical protein C8J55DRAFT_567602 [Lentinula edodes]
MSGQRRSTRLRATKGGGTDMMQNSTKTPSSPQKNPPKWNCKGSQATSPLHLRIPGKSTVQKAVESLLNSPPELELEESEPEIDQLESKDTGTRISSVVKGRKRRKSRSITPPLIDKKAIRKAAIAEGGAIMLKARAKYLIQNQNQVPMEIKELTPAYSGESDIEISHGAIESEEEVDELDKEELPQVAKSHKTRKGKPKVKQQVEDEYSNGDKEEEDVAEYRKKQKHLNKDSLGTKEGIKALAEFIEKSEAFKKTGQPTPETREPRLEDATVEGGNKVDWEEEDGRIAEEASDDKDE